MKYRPEIDGLRTVAVLPVIFFHAGIASFSGGFVGVDVFFVISGFLITSILLSDLDKDRYSLLTFYERRARRILPALLLVILCTIPAAWAILLPSDLLDFGRSIIATMTFSSNILFWRESGYFDAGTEFKPLLHTWSLAVEEQFYILFPLLLALLFRRSRRLLWPVLILLAAVSLAAAHVGSGVSASATFYLLPTRGWELLIGVFAALLVWQNRLVAPGPKTAQILSALGLAGIFGSILLLDESLPFPGLYALPATLGTALVLLFAHPGTLAHRVLSLRPMVMVGLISYSAYLWHQPLIALYHYRFPQAEEGAIIMGLISLPLAWLSWKYIEAPFRTKSLLAGRKQYLTASMAALLLMCAVGLGLTFQGGWKDRYSPMENAVFASFKDGKVYVPTRFNQLRGAAFAAEMDRPRILLIGDSYGQDLVNALYESGLEQQLDLSTHHISARCGNLMIDGLESYQAPRDRAGCARAVTYSSADLQARMAEADQIWLASSWNAWSAPLLPASLKRIAAQTDTPVVVFGRKHFGHRVLREYHADGLQALIGEREVPADLAAVQAEMAETIPSVTRYVDLQKLLCGQYDRCSNQDDQGRPLSFDGTHLTPEGALYLGKRLSMELLPE